MNKRVAELDALRGVAAVSVVVFHIFSSQKGFEFVRYGVTGVDLFFLISGFVIFMSISYVASAKEFIVNRFSRLFPVYWLCVTFTFLLFLIQYLKIFEYSFSPKLFATYAANLTMLQTYFNVGDIDGSYWTLLVELQFYAFIVLLFQFKLLKHIGKIGLTILFFILIYNAVIIHIFPESKNFSVYFPLFNHFALFFAGIIFYKLYYKLIDQYKAGLIILCCFLLQATLFDHVGRAFYSLSQVEYMYPLTLYFLIFTLLAYQRLKFIENKYLLFFGKISYPLYVVHQFLSVYFLMPFFTKRLALPVGLAGCITFLIVTILAAFITNFIETPMRIKLKRRFIKIKDPNLMIAPVITQ